MLCSLQFSSPQPCSIHSAYLVSYTAFPTAQSPHPSPVAMAESASPAASPPRPAETEQAAAPAGRNQADWHTTAVAASFSIALAPPHAAAAAPGPNSSAPKSAQIAASVAGEMETPLMEASHRLGDIVPAGTSVILERTSSGLFIRLPPVHPAKAALGFTYCVLCALIPLLMPLILDDGEGTGEQTPFPLIMPVASAICTLLAFVCVCSAFVVRTMRIDGSQLLHTWQLFGWTINTAIPTASIVRIDLCKMEWAISNKYFCEVAAADGEQLDFSGHLSKEDPFDSISCLPARDLQQGSIKPSWPP
ncbi:unnamed protein product [Closterium sp. Yama58-4]|nr:unnamed protein product [Closterium sp. Yama58-4]